MSQALLWAAGGTGFTFLMTALGAATVFFLGRKNTVSLQQILLGFAAGVMIASSVWSLLNPAIEAAEAIGLPGWLPAAGGLIAGTVCLLGTDALLPHLTKSKDQTRQRSTLLALAVTIHNIPEGMAVGLSFSLAAQDPSTLPAAAALALGVGIQNLPEGAAIALPLCQDGLNRRQSFGIGALSGIVEPIAAVITVMIAGSIQALLPWLLSFAAGAMLYVVVEELIPQASGFSERKNHRGTLGAMAGFLIMMVLDVALG